VKLLACNELDNAACVFLVVVCQLTLLVEKCGLIDKIYRNLCSSPIKNDTLEISDVVIQITYVED